VGRPLGESLERGNAVNTMDLDLDDDDTHLDNSLEDSLKESNVTELKLSKRRLERQVRTLQEGGAAEKSQKAMILQHLLDDANRLKTQFEKNYIEVSHERDILQSDMARIREDIPDSVLQGSQHVMSLRLHIIDLEKETKQLWEDMNKLDQQMTNSTGNIADNLDYQAQYKLMEEKKIQLEEQSKKQQEEINNLTLDRDMLENQYGDQRNAIKENEQFCR
jgi:protein HOOK3